jgi:hypothetical protein
MKRKIFQGHCRICRAAVATCDHFYQIVPGVYLCWPCALDCAKQIMEVQTELEKEEMKARPQGWDYV